MKFNTLRTVFRREEITGELRQQVLPSAVEENHQELVSAQE